MERILGKVTVEELDGYLKKIMELVSNDELGHFWLSQIGQLARQEPLMVLTKKWRKDLANEYTWKHAEEHFSKTGKLWFNELEWPFQICVLEVGGLDNVQLHKKWLNKYENCYSERQLAGDIMDIDLTPVKPKRKILLIRLQPRFLGFYQDMELCEINRNHPELNFGLCPEETAFYMRPFVSNYLHQKPTYFAMNFQPPTMVEGNKQRVFYFTSEKGHRNDLYLGAWDISKKFKIEINSYWIFQYKFPQE